MPDMCCNFLCSLQTWVYFYCCKWQNMYAVSVASTASALGNSYFYSWKWQNIYAISMASTASALGSMLNANAESVDCQSALDMYPAFPQMTRDELLYISSNCICWLQQTWEYFYGWEWQNIYAIGMASLALALGSMVNADAESARLSLIHSRYVPSSGSNDKKWAAEHPLSFYMLTTNMSINLCLGMKKYLCHRHGIKSIGIGLNGQCRCWWCRMVP